MKPELLFLLVLFSFFGLSCRKYSRLTKKERELIPYSGNETLLFDSDKQDTDTFFLTGYKNYFTTEKTGKLKKIESEHYDLMCFNSSDSSDVYLAALTSRSSAGTFLSFNIHDLKKGYFFWNSINIDSVYQGQKISLDIRHHIYSDVLVIGNMHEKKGDDSLSITATENNISKIYWSKERGIIRFDLKDGTPWQIKF